MSDDLNIFIEAMVREALDKRKHEPDVEDREILWLYRLMSVIHRIRYPTTKTEPSHLQPDMLVYVEDKICKQCFEYNTSRTFLIL
jgi:hypothetical protein